MNFLELKAERAVDLELRWMDSADIKVHYITVTAHPLTNYVLTDGINSVEAKTSDKTNLNELNWVQITRLHNEARKN